jgi:DNA-binding IclR family transcriptional regulator
VRILDAFRPGEVTLRVTDIAARADLHLATASRLVAELVAHGLLSRDSDRRVRIGLRLWELGSRASPALSLREAAMPFLEDLHAVVGHHVQVGVLDGSDVLFVERLSAPGAVINYTRIAGRLPLHASSSGQVLLAHAPGDLQEAILAAPLERFTAHTITEPGELRAALAAVRREGYAFCPGHLHEQALGVAVPVVDAHGRVVAALSAVVPNDGGGRALIPVLRTAARGVTRALTGRRPPSAALTQ